jgi:hypothetical protein
VARETQTKRKKGEIKMADKRKNTREEFFNCCDSMPFAQMMRNMMNQRGEESDSNCAEMMQKMMDQESGCCDFDCSEMMARMTTMCCQQQEEKKETAEEVEESQATT